jgi:hypothetical protein
MIISKYYIYIKSKNIINGNISYIHNTFASELLTSFDSSRKYIKKYLESKVEE